MVHRHVAWFRRDTGQWLGEWAGDVPAPAILQGWCAIRPWWPAWARDWAMRAWLQRVQATITPHVWDRNAWDACPAGGAVCLDVTRFGWPVGDHCWHRWIEVEQLLDWGPMHKYIQIDRATLRVDVNTESHRPVRSTAGKIVIDITGTALEPFYGHLFGQVTRRNDQWTFEPDGHPHVVPPSLRRRLAAAPLDPIAVALGARRKEPVHV